MSIWKGDERVIKSYSFASPAGTSGIYYAAGYYSSPVTSSALSDCNLTQVYDSVNVLHAAHAFIVAGGIGAADTGIVSIVVSGTSITDGGIRIALDTEIILADITTSSLNAYYETVKKWIGQITFTITPSGGASTFSLDVNYGYCKYDDLSNYNFLIKAIECVGKAGASDTGFNITLLHHKPTGWTYHDTAFLPGGNVLADMNTDYVAEINLLNGQEFAYKRDNLSAYILGAKDEGFIIRITTSANKSVEFMNCHIGIII